MEDVEIYYDPAELFGGLLKGPLITTSLNQDHEDANNSIALGARCPLQH